MTHTTHEALRELDRVLAKVEQDGKPFDMRTFGRPECGTAVCVAGWAMRDRQFAEWGLIPVKMGGGYVMDGCEYMPSFLDEKPGFNSLRRFFGLSFYDTETLFYRMSATLSDQRAIVAALLATAPDNVGEGEMAAP